MRSGHVLAVDCMTYGPAGACVMRSDHLLGVGCMTSGWARRTGCGVSRASNACSV